MRRGQQGFTLVELMVVVAMIGILSYMAVAYTGESRANLKSFGGSVLAEADQAKMRALASRRWHRVRFDLDAYLVITDQATFTGMSEPADDEWTMVSQVPIPKKFHVQAITTTADVDVGNDPGDGDGIDEALLFAPDGSSAARTVYLSTVSPYTYVRVVVYRATGTAYLKEGW